MGRKNTPEGEALRKALAEHDAKQAKRQAELDEIDPDIVDAARLGKAAREGDMKTAGEIANKHRGRKW